MKKNLLLASLFLFTLSTACVSLRESKQQPGSGSARVELRKQGVTLDAKYNPQLDNLIPGYKIITVGVTNNGIELLKLNPLRDRWEIIDAYGRPQKGINSIRIKDPAVWSRLPDKVKELIEYPIGITVGYTETVDLFFPNNIDLSAFRSISFYSAERKETYDILALDETTQQLNIPTQVNEVPANKKNSKP